MIRRNYNNFETENDFAAEIQAKFSQLFTRVFHTLKQGAKLAFHEAGLIPFAVVPVTIAKLKRFYNLSVVSSIDFSQSAAQKHNGETHIYNDYPTIFNHYLLSVSKSAFVTQTFQMQTSSFTATRKNDSSATQNVAFSLSRRSQAATNN